MTQQSPTLPPLTEPQTLIIDADVGSRAYTPWQMREYGRTCYAEGRRAALLEAVELLASVNNYDNPMTAYDCADKLRHMAAGASNEQ